MKTLKLVALGLALIFSAAVLADVEEEREMKIVIQGMSDDDSTSFHWVSDDSGFDMQNMQVGETHSIVDESGRSVLITRQEEGFEFNIDGETMVVPDMGAHGMAITSGADFTTDVDVEFIANHEMMGLHEAGSVAIMGGQPHVAGVTIISGEPLDDSVRESIKSVLLSAGRNDDVTFIDGSGSSDSHQVRIIKKHIEISQ
jgi:hypothetical protein